ncbi:MAG: hypothetical protein Q8Q31_01370 [Nanoarchaeota archaeon]|nr:hypothetical protein [Nanoarchaeota archaeon]
MNKDNPFYKVGFSGCLTPKKMTSWEIRHKRGELTTTQIAIIIFAIAGFLIILFFIGKLGFENLTQKELCHLSVLTRATAPESAQTYVPLKCQTQKTCLYGKDSRCKTSFAGEKVENIKLDKDEIKAAAQVEEASAKAMYDCWQMMGEGKLDLFHSLAAKYGVGSEERVCVICSRIAVDTELERANQIFENTDLGEYLQTHQPPEREDGQTYLQIFTDKGVSSYAKVPDEKIFQEGKTDVQFSNSANNPEVAVVFMQIKPISYGEAFSNLASLGAAGATSGFVIAPKTSLTVGGWIAKGILRFPLVAAIAGAGGASYVALNVHAGRVAAAGYCGEVTIPGQGNAKINKDSAKNGCSMVQILPYEARTINDLCDYIESSP